MMDFENIVSNQQSLVQAAGAILSERSLNLGTADTLPAAFQAVGTPFKDVGRGGPLFCFVKVTETFDSAGDAVTCKVALVSADNAALDSNLTVIYETAAIAQAVLLAGYQFLLGSVPPGITQQYLGFRYTTAVADATAGKVYGAFTPTPNGTVRVVGAGS